MFYNGDKEHKYVLDKRYNNTHVPECPSIAVGLRAILQKGVMNMQRQESLKKVEGEVARMDVGGEQY